MGTKNLWKTVWEPSMMKFLDFLKPRPARPSAASIAKERLQIIVSHKLTNDPDFIQRLQNELLEVISKYVTIDREKIRVQLERSGEQSILELNVALSDALEVPKTKSAEESINL